MAEQSLQKAKEAFQQGDLDRVEKICRKLIKRSPLDLDAKYLLALAHYGRQKYKASEKLLEEILRADAENAVALNSLGLVYNETGRFRKAIKTLEHAYAVAPLDPDVVANLATAYRGNRQYPRSKELFEQSIHLAPMRQEFHQNYGSLLLDCHEYEAAAVQYEKALEIDPDYLKALSNLAIALTQLKAFSRAQSCYERALQLASDQAADVKLELICGLADLAVAEGKLTRAREFLEQGRQIDAASPRLISTMEGVHYFANDREALGALIDHALGLYDDPFIASSRIMLNLYEYPFQRERIQQFTAEFRRRYESPLKAERFSPVAVPVDGRAIRLGFISRDIRAHSVGYFVSALFPEINRHEFDIHVYDDSPKNDHVSEQMKAYCTSWTSIEGLSDDKVAGIIEAAALDVLVDLGGHTTSHRLGVMMRRPCVRQVSWLGFPCTTGLETMDYIIGDPYTLPPDEEDFYAERVLRMPSTNICYEPPEAATRIAVRSSPVQFNGHVTFGCFNNLAKVNAAVIETWCELMGQVKGSRLILKDIRFSSKEVSDDLRAQFERGGVSADRVEFAGYLSHTEHFGLYHSVDIGLDPFPYNGTTTTCEALFMGVPTLTLKSSGSMTCKYGELINLAVGLNDFIAADRQDYVEKGRALAGDLGTLAEIRQSCRTRMLESPLCDKAEFARGFEALMRSIVTA